MTGPMGGIYEARDKHGGTLYRLFCLLDRKAGDRGASGPLVVLLCGGQKAVRTVMPTDTYDDARVFRQHYLSAGSCPIER